MFSLRRHNVREDDQPILFPELARYAALYAAAMQSQAQLDAARIAAEESRFRPIGITTRFGGSQFTTGEDGRVSGASYTLTPELRAMQDR